MSYPRAKPLGEARDRCITVRFNAREEERMNKVARAAGHFSLREWLRELGLREADRVESESS